VLAAPLIFNKVAYFTTYQPNWTPSTDPCTPGNLGISRLYAVNYKTGEAVLNFANANTANNNDTESTSNNTRALSATGQVLRKADREITLGVGIPSGLVVLMPPSGDAKLLIGCGGGLCSEDPVIGGTIIPVYWMQW
jgi:type IV pilus assembly protein PilY1